MSEMSENLAQPATHVVTYLSVASRRGPGTLLCSGISESSAV